ncbi:MAG: lipid-A-disaccharide synthase [Woeseia sp.]|nr:lipid-A-disaccharide synthase [Woeseia sp.]MBT8096144.1 lipid-A-disaccharide synthase [Woeseia sp.]NNE62036.1 lipid-A-disaccharide synthase [Woeseia sp.]NNL55056.1 lipid-A-disaccharide synthase [Woeseia sp.]
MRIGLVAGEASGDLLAAGLIGALRRKVPGIRFEGVTGNAMAAAGCESLGDADDLAVMGLVEPLRRVPRLLKLRRSLVRHWQSQPPDVFVGVDAPDFNLSLERQLKARGIATVHYVSPSVWAWRQGRVKKIARSADKVLCLLPFEKAFYDRHDVAAEFVGHPMADNLPTTVDAKAARAALGIKAARVVAIMPGSRMSEVSRLGDLFILTAKSLLARYPDLGFVTPLANDRTRDAFAQQLAAAGMRDHFTLLTRQSQQAIIASDTVLLASGTAALEAALLSRSMVAAYRLAPLTYWLVRTLRLVKVDYFTLPNQLTAEPLVPEFLQSAATPQSLAEAVAHLLDDMPRRQAIEQAFASLRETLGRNANERAADAVLALAARAPERY